MRADAHEVVHRAERAHLRPIFHGHVSAKRRGVRQKHVVADSAIVRNVRVGHDQHVAADLVRPPPLTVPRLMVTNSRISL